MNLYFRLLFGILISRFRPAITTSGRTETRFRVWPQDLDVFGHMNNGRYLQIMDIARSTWMSRCGALAAMGNNKWGAVLGGGTVHFGKSLRAFQSYQVTTRLVCWDHRWFYLEHGFVDNAGRCVAAGISRAALRRSGGWVNTADVFAIVDPDAVSVPVPEHIKALTRLEEVMFRECARVYNADNDESGQMTGLPPGRNNRHGSHHGSHAKDSKVLFEQGEAL